MTATVSNPPVRRKRGTHVIEWPKLPDDFVLPDDPVEDEAQPLLAAALTDALGSVPATTESALVVSNFALCASVDGRIICKAPDWMYVAPVEPVKGIRRSYTPHTEGVIPPVVMEFLSESDCGEYSVQSGRKLGKWYFYEQKEAEAQAKEAEAQAKESETRAQVAESENARLLAKLKAAGLE